MDNPFVIACTNGNLIEAQKLYEYNNDLINISFLNACLKGHFHIVVWLYYLKDINIDINCMNSSFVNACISGNFNIAQWLYFINNKINVHHDNYEAFVRSCIYEKLNFAKWLYYLNDDKPNLEAIVIAYTNAYSECCADIEKWLLSLININNIRENNDDIFKEACKNNDIDTIAFLINVCNKYIVYYDEYGKIIKWDIKN